MDVTELKKAMMCCIKMDCVQCPLGTVIGCDQKLAEEVMAYIDDLEERLSIMQESMEAQEKRCKTLEALEQRCKELEKRNEPIEPIVVPIGEDDSIPFIRYKCPKCGMFQIEFKPNYCSGCGQAVKWND